MTQRGLFITFEGTEGSGKSTQMRLLVERLRGEGLSVRTNQEPGGTAIGKEVRRILLDPANAEMASKTELLLMFASRAQAAHETIKPALERGEIVVSDRFTDSSMAYQGGGRHLGFDIVRELHRLALGSLQPDITLCVMLDLETGLTRAHRRNARETQAASEARIDRQSLEFHRRVEAAYRRIAAAEPERFRVVDGAGTIDAVSARVWQEVQSRLVTR